MNNATVTDRRYKQKNMFRGTFTALPTIIPSEVEESLI